MALNQRPSPTSSLAAYKNISPLSGKPTIIHPHFNPAISSHVPPDTPHQPFTPPKDRAFFADPAKAALLSILGAKAVDLTESIGTELKGVQLSQLDGKQLDELAALVNERGVVFFRDQDLTTEKQVELFEHFGILDKHPAQKVCLNESCDATTTKGHEKRGERWLTESRTRNTSLSKVAMPIGARFRHTRHGQTRSSMLIRVLR